MKGLPTYPAYKPAAVSWLQQVPEHWEVSPGLSHLRFKQEKNTGMVEKQVLSLSYGRIVIKPKEKLTGLVPESFETYQIVGPGDIIVRATDLQNDRTSLRIGEVKDRGIITSAYLCLNVHSGMVPSFGYYLIHAYDLMKVLYGFGSGLRQNLDWKDFKRMPLAVPPPEEQHLIVRYLHALDAKVKRYIRTKRTLIAALQEQKQAIIQRAVTRGLDPNVKLKPSGVEWLGEVPEHWVLRRFKFSARIRSGQVDPRQAPYRSLVLIAPNHIQSGTGKLLAQQTAHEQGADSGKYWVQRGEVVYSKIRPNLRKATIAPVDCLCSADMYPITPVQEILPEYLLLIILSPQFTKFAVDTSMRAAMPKINREDLANCWLWFPELEEQQAILESIERESRPYDAGVGNAEREIQLMLEYHTRLIADEVTGAVDVREAAKAIAVEAEEVMEEEPLSMAAEGEEGYREDDQ